MTYNGARKRDFVGCRKTVFGHTPEISPAEVCCQGRILPINKSNLHRELGGDFMCIPGRLHRCKISIEGILFPVDFVDKPVLLCYNALRNRIDSNH
jgi:hypothetical protein